MTSTKTNSRDVEPVANALHFLQSPLDCNQLGITVINCDHSTDPRDNRVKEDPS